MPDYSQDDQRGQALPRKPRDFDEAAQASERNQQRETDGQRQVGKEWGQRQDRRRSDAQRQLDKTSEPTPAMRLYGRDRLVNTDQGRSQDQSKPLGHMTPAQVEMMQKLNTTREADRQQTRTAYHDKEYVKLPEKQPPDQAAKPPGKELTEAQRQMADKLRAARETDRAARGPETAPAKSPPERSR